MEEFKTDVFDTIKADSIPIITQTDSPVQDPVQLESFIDEEETEDDDDDDQFEDADDSELIILETSITTNNSNNNEDGNGSNFNDTVIHNDRDSSRDKITDPISTQMENKAKTITPKKQKRLSRLISTNSQSLNMIGSSPVNSDNEISNFEENLDIDLDLE
ncbi:unnamed protein product [[Candida] boidinii]|nr:unnamed protein product [[Candida] boidinii]